MSEMNPRGFYNSLHETLWTCAAFLWQTSFSFSLVVINLVKFSTSSLVNLDIYIYGKHSFSLDL